MKWPPFILSRYLARQYIFTLLGLLGILLAIIYLLDTVEILRRAGKRDDVLVPITLILQMGFLKLPEATQVILPFAILFSGMFTFWSLSRRYELAVIRSAGLSVWQFLLPIISVGFLCGVLYITLSHPLGAMFLGRFEQLETRYLGAQHNLVSVFQDGFWIRERESEDGQILLNAEKINLKDWSFSTVMGLAFNAEGRLISRLDANRAELRDGYWFFEDVHITQRGSPDTYRDSFELPTTLTRDDIEESFASPETIPFWQIPSFIRILEATGFNSTRLRVHFHYLLALPLMFTSMILLAAVVSLRPPRSHRNLTMACVGVGLSVVIFFLSSYLQALGSSQQLSPVLAAWSPACITFLLGLSAILTLEDG
jgi:lipopolysaccharide export system permease protein